MAFEVPLEADTVKDNLLVSLISGPILGGLMWILGDEAQQRDESWSELHRGMQDIVLDDIDDVDDLQPSNVKQKSLPHLVRSELTMDCAEEHSCNSQPDISFGIRNQEASSSDNFLGFNHRHRTEKKKMSWSDNLVEYMDDESVRHEPPASGNGSSPTVSKPIKSAMTRSTSIRSHSLVVGSSAAGEKDRKIRYLPNGLDRAHNGLIMPTRPMGMGGVGSDPHGNGIESPQWGWYINTTPPTPEMYHSRSSLKHRKSDHSAASSASSEAVTSFDNPATRGPNRVFQGLKAGSRPPVGWPSVPL